MLCNFIKISIEVNVLISVIRFDRLDYVAKARN